MSLEGTRRSSTPELFDQQHACVPDSTARPQTTTLPSPLRAVAVTCSIHSKRGSSQCGPVHWNEHAHETLASLIWHAPPFRQRNRHASPEVPSPSVTSFPIVASVIAVASGSSPPASGAEEASAASAGAASGRSLMEPSTGAG